MKTIKLQKEIKALQVRLNKMLDGVIKCTAKMCADLASKLDKLEERLNQVTEAKREAKTSSVKVYNVKYTNDQLVSGIVGNIHVIQLWNNEKEEQIEFTYQLENAQVKNFRNKENKIAAKTYKSFKKLLVLNGFQLHDHFKNQLNCALFHW